MVESSSYPTSENSSQARLETRDVVVRPFDPQTVLNKHSLSSKIRNFGLSLFNQGQINAADLADPSFLKTESKVYDTAYHEALHYCSVVDTGSIPLAASVVPEGNTRGWMRFAINPGASLYDKLRSGIRIALSPLQGQWRIGVRPNDGCGSDIGQAYYLSHLISQYFYRGNKSASEIFNQESFLTSQFLPSHERVLRVADKMYSQRKVIYS